VLTPADYGALKTLLESCVRGSLKICHMRDPRAVENLARHLLWTQIWELNETRKDRNIEEFNKEIINHILRGVVDDCVKVALRSKECVLFKRIAEDQEIFGAAVQMTRALFVDSSADIDFSLKVLVERTVHVLQSADFVNFVCEKMFQVAPRYQSCENLTRAMFAEWRSTRKVPLPMEGFVSGLVEKLASSLLKQIVLQYVR